MTTTIILLGDYADDQCDGCGHPGATCEADGFVFHNATCWAEAERAFLRTPEGLARLIGANLDAMADTYDYLYGPPRTWHEDRPTTVLWVVG